MDRTLLILVGLPFSGKSTKAKELGFPTVAPDAVRLAIHGKSYCPEAEGIVWTLMRYMVASLFNAGHPYVILDGTNSRRRRRDQWINPKWERKFIVSPLDAYECQKRAERIQDTLLREQLTEAINNIARDFDDVNEMEEGEILNWESPLCETNLSEYTT